MSRVSGRDQIRVGAGRGAPWPRSVECLRVRRTHDENHLRELNDSGPDAHSVESVDLKRRTSLYLDRKGGGWRREKCQKDIK